jgi:cytochrome c peroxidase
MTLMRGAGVLLATIGLIVLGFAGVSIGDAQTLPHTEALDVPRMIGSLKSASVPTPAKLSEFVADPQAAVALGKAFFWDQQMGSDGMTACASCHYQAGADIRTKNTISPGVLGGSTSWFGKGPNYQLAASDFPFHQLMDPDDAHSLVVADTNNVTGAQGVFSRTFNLPGIPAVLTKGVDSCISNSDPVFNIGGVNARRVTGRNAPTVVNAAYNFRNFWDGRANNNFNGVNPFGDRDPNAVIFKTSVGSTTPQPTHISIPLSSLASQAVGPPGSAFEMSCGGRIFPNMGRKMLTGVPLGQQPVDPSDSVLGTYANARTQAGAKGLNTTYIKMIQKAFKPEYWSSLTPITIGSSSPITPSLLMSDLIKLIAPGKVVPLTQSVQVNDQIQIPTNKYTQMEANFSLFWGLAIQLYENTLISNDAPVDQFFDRKKQPPTSGKPILSPAQLDGLAIFQNEGKCMNCHGGPETTNASIAKVTTARLERMRMGDSRVAVYDDGFYNIGVRPTSEDIGLGGTDPFGAPLSEVKLCQQQLAAGGACDAAVQNILGRPNEGLPAGKLTATERTAVQGNFKVPNLRNVELTGPYFHNGSQATLREVVDFYNRGGDFSDSNQGDLDTDVSPIGLTDEQKDHLVDFMLALTDERVRWERAPFDHPALCLPNGHPASSAGGLNKNAANPLEAIDDKMCLPAVGAAGRTTAQGPLKSFLNLDPHEAAAVPTRPVAAGTDPSSLSAIAAADAHGTSAAFFAPPPAPGAAPAATLLSWGQTAPSGMTRINGHTWVADHVQGLCRLDLAPGATEGTPLYTINTDTCDPNGTIGSPGTPAYDRTANADGTHYVYVPDSSRKSPGLWRVTYHPDTDTIDNPELMVPGAGLAGLRVTGTVVGPDGNVYVGSLNNAGIHRINNPRSTPREQWIDTIAQTTDGRGINGSMAFATRTDDQGVVHNDLYIPENRAMTVIADATACSPFGCFPIPVSAGLTFTNAVATDGNQVYVSTTLPAPGGGAAARGALTQSVIMRFTPQPNFPSLGQVVTFETQGQTPPAGPSGLIEYCFEGAPPEGCTRPPDPWTTAGAPSGLFFILGMYLDPDSGVLYFGDDPLAGARFGSGHTWFVNARAVR